MTPETTLPAKRGPGRPKGSKNKPDAGTKGNPVGRPRKHLLTDDASTDNAYGTYFHKQGLHQLTGCVGAVPGNAPEQVSQRGTNKRRRLTIGVEQASADSRYGEFSIMCTSPQTHLALPFSFQCRVLEGIANQMRRPQMSRPSRSCTDVCRSQMLHRPACTP